MTVRILVVDDYEPWRHRVRSLLQARPEWQVICEVSDGPEAIQKAKDLAPDLILLDIALPTLNGIEAARRIRELSPSSRIVFLSADNNLDTRQVALSTGAEGYVWKPRAQSDLLPAIDAVLRGNNFVSKTHAFDTVAASDEKWNQPGKDEQSVVPLEDNFDIYSEIPDGDAIWLESVVGLSEAEVRMKEIASKSPGAYFIFQSRSNSIAVKLDTRITTIRKNGS